MKKCKNYKRYQGVFAPTCLGGGGCVQCWIKFFTFTKDEIDWADNMGKKLGNISGVELLIMKLSEFSDLCKKYNIAVVVGKQK